MKFLTLVCLFFVFLTALHAEPITFAFQSATIGTTTVAPPDGNWHATPDEAAIYKFLATGMPFDDGSVGVAWAAVNAPLGAFPLGVEYAFSLTGTVCVATSCAQATFTGVLVTAADGLRWKLPPQAMTLQAQDGRFLYLTPDAHGHVELKLFGERNGPPNAPIPEPLTLITVGSGLAGLAALAKRKKA